MIKLYISPKIASQIKHLIEKHPYLSPKIIQTLDRLRTNPQHQLLTTIELRKNQVYACYFAKQLCLTYFRRHADIYLLEINLTTDSPT